MMRRLTCPFSCVWVRRDHPASYKSQYPSMQRTDGLALKSIAARNVKLPNNRSLVLEVINSNVRQSERHKKRRNPTLHSLQVNLMPPHPLSTSLAFQVALIL